MIANRKNNIIFIQEEVNKRKKEYRHNKKVIDEKEENINESIYNKIENELEKREEILKQMSQMKEKQKEESKEESLIIKIFKKKKMIMIMD